MMPLVGNDEPAFIHGGTGRQVDSGLENAHDEGRRNAVGKIDFPLQRHRFRQFAPQNQVLGNAVSHHDGCPCRPNVRGDLHGRGLRLLRWLGWGNLLPDRCGGVLPDRLGNALIGDCADAGGGGHRDGLQHGQPGGNGQGAQKPEQHHRPQSVGIDFRRPFQEQPRQQHHGNDDAAGETHVENFRENSLHTLTPAWNRLLSAIRQFPRQTASSGCQRRLRMREENR